MKIKICTIILLLCAFSLYAQADKDSRKVQLADGSFVLPDKYPEVTKHVKPVYPRQAILQDLQGKVFVKVTINETGKVEGVKIAQGINSSLDKAAMAAAKKMEFTPAVYQGKVVKVSIAVPVNFVLDPEKKGPDVGIPVPVEDAKANRNNIQDLMYRENSKAVAPQDLKKGEDPDPSSFIPVEKNPEPIQLVKPYYPEIAKRAGLTGVVILRVLVSKEGKPIRTVVIKSENDIFVEPAKKAAMETLFTPAMQGGKPIMCWVNIPFRFSLGGDNPKVNKMLNIVVTPGDPDGKYPKNLAGIGIEGSVNLLSKYDMEGKYISSEITRSTNSEFDQTAADIIKVHAFEKNIAYKNTIDGKDYYFVNYNLQFSIPKKTKTVFYPEDPEYPKLAVEAGIEGLVEVVNTFNLQGTLIKSEITQKTNTILDETAVELMKGPKIQAKATKKVAGADGIQIQVTKAVEFKLKK